MFGYLETGEVEGAERPDGLKVGGGGEQDDGFAEFLVGYFGYDERVGQVWAQYRLDFFYLQLYAAAANHVVAPPDDAELPSVGRQSGDVVGDERMLAHFGSVDDEAPFAVGADADAVER